MLRPSCPFEWTCAVVAGLAISVCFLPTAAGARTTAVALPDGRPYAIGVLKKVKHIWVDPAKGVDGAGRGWTAGTPVKSFSAAWSKVPSTLRQPHVIHIAPGSFGPSQVPEWIENKAGTYLNPIIVQADEARTVTFKTYLALRFCKYIYFIGINIAFGGNSDGNHPFHCEGCVGLLLRRMTVRGAITGAYKTRETVKLNQCRGVYVESCDFAVSTDNALDAVAVQYGHLINSRFHDVGFGVYVKGGSASITIANNRVYRTGELGIAAGFDTGFEWMTYPWLRFEAYDIKIINNIIYDIDAAPGIAVYGGYDVLVAHNTLYRVGRTTAVFSVRHGHRTCDGEFDERCTQYFKQGGWGPPGEPVAPWSMERLPNKNVRIVNNLVVNPPDYVTARGIFYVPQPLPFCHEYSNQCKPGSPPRPNGLPAIPSADAGLEIRGNLIYTNAKLGLNPLDPNILGITSDAGYETGCRNKATSPTCYPSLVVAQNAINTVAAQLNNPQGGDFRPRNATLCAFPKLWSPLPAWGPWAPYWDASAPGPAVPSGNLVNAVTTDAAGKARTAANNAPGAFVCAF